MFRSRPWPFRSARARQLVKPLARGRSVGAIDIQNNFSIVEISAELAAHVLATLNKGVFISGVKVSAKAADETDSPHPRKPFAPGQRRQRPGKFGKKPRGATLGRKAYSESR